MAAAKVAWACLRRKSGGISATSDGGPKSGARSLSDLPDGMNGNNGSYE